MESDKSAAETLRGTSMSKQYRAVGLSLALIVALFGHPQLGVGISLGIALSHADMYWNREQ